MKPTPLNESELRDPLNSKKKNARPRNVVDGGGGRDESSSVEYDGAIYRLELAMYLPGHAFQPTSCKGKETSSQFRGIYQGEMPMAGRT
jgi:hypothetical protein